MGDRVHGVSGLIGHTGNVLADAKDVLADAQDVLAELR